jgi:hypothetical protein
MKPMNDFECTAIGGGTSPANPDDSASESIDPRHPDRLPRYSRDVIDPVPYLPDQAY